LIRKAPNEACTAHVPWGRVHGFDLNGLRRCVARLKRAGRVPYGLKTAPRIRVATIRPSQDLRPLERASFGSSYFFRLRSRPSRNRLDACGDTKFIKPRNLAVERPLLSWRCCGGRRLTRAARVPSLMASVAPPLPPLHPVRPVRLGCPGCLGLSFGDKQRCRARSNP
jgi:hypothetical protein